MIELLENKPIPNHSTNVLDIQRIHSSLEKLKEFFCKFWNLSRAVVAYCITGVPLAIIWRYSSLYKQQGNIIFLYWPDEIVFIANATPSKQIAGKKEKINKKAGSWPEQAFLLTFHVVSFHTLILSLDSYLYDSIIIVRVIERANAIQKLYFVMEGRIEKRLLNGFYVDSTEEAWVQHSVVRFSYFHKTQPFSNWRD